MCRGGGGGGFQFYSRLAAVKIVTKSNCVTFCFQFYSRLAQKMTLHLPISQFL